MEAPFSPLGTASAVRTLGHPLHRPGGPAAKLKPSPEGLGINPEDDLSAVGAALNQDPVLGYSQ
jgi:hypothetical protein